MQTRERVRALQERNHGQALEAFIARKLEIDGVLQRLTALSGDHFGVDPETVDWSHVGTLGHYANLLRRISESALQEGEHAG